MMEEGPPRCGRRVGFGVFEGVKNGSPVLWGGRRESDLEVVDAETIAIEQYLRKATAAGHKRILVLSDCVAALQAIESAWRHWKRRELRKHDRGMILEHICHLRERADTVVFLWTPAHAGVTPNAYADAAAKSYCQHGTLTKVYDEAARSSVAKPCTYWVDSDFGQDGTLLPTRHADRHLHGAA